MHTSINLRVCSWLECLRGRVFLRFDFHVLIVPVNFLNCELARHIDVLWYVFRFFFSSRAFFLFLPKIRTASHADFDRMSFI